MATFEAAKERAVAIELREKVVTAYLAFVPMYRAVQGWTLNSYDANLPTPFEVKTQLDAYQNFTREALRLAEWVKEFQQATIDDTLTYPPPPKAFDGAGTFSGDLNFDGGEPA